jgi:dihydroneopterin aldolase
MATISIEGMEFHAYHGCFEEEQLIGNTFMVDVHMDTETTSAEQSDNLEETVNYADVFQLVKEQMAVNSKLLEHVGRRIMDVILEKYPQVDIIELKISKLNPPVGGKVHAVSVTMDNIDDDREED